MFEEASSTPVSCKNLSKQSNFVQIVHVFHKTHMQYDVQCIRNIWVIFFNHCHPDVHHHFICSFQ